jgi:hypothetical protein
MPEKTFAVMALNSYKWHYHIYIYNQLEKKSDLFTYFILSSRLRTNIHGSKMHLLRHQAWEDLHQLWRGPLTSSLLDLAADATAKTKAGKIQQLVTRWCPIVS